MNENVFAKYSLSLVFSLHSYLAFYNNIYHLDLGNITLGQLDYLSYLYSTTATCPSLCNWVWLKSSEEKLH